MPPSPLRLVVLDARAPGGRSGRAVAEWFRSRARRHPDLELDVVVLAELDLPLFLPPAGHPAVAPHAARIGAADAVVVITPEYNQSFPGGLKQAIDVVRGEWAAKPVAFVTYGGVSGGLRAADQLRPVFAELHAVAIRDTVSFVRPWERLRGDRFEPDPGADAAAETLLDELTWWATLLREARTGRSAAA
ncbi:MAG: NAD(P)H-dependent oxidoreductase [Actinobacteria bacterium]|nr:NAD(P)H-dependent oxidoreductase [Actinomycetota bacterium]